uniref:Uncharacterized protein n=1 Tax=Anguilla anguilla TaxID=7936 RepID=A0A0E9TC65_ANGAN
MGVVVQGGSSLRISVCLGTRTGGSTGVSTRW